MNTATTEAARAWTHVHSAKGTVNIVRDEDCPSCEFPETITVISNATHRALRIGCTHCGYWRTAKEWNKRKVPA